MNVDSTTTKNPAIYWLNNPFDITNVTKYDIDQSLTIRQWLDGNGGIKRLNYLPTVCVYKGRELLRAEYDQIIDDHVCFVMMPTGGDSGTNPLAAVAMIALTVYTGGLASFWLDVGYSAFQVGISQAAIMVGGGMLINAVFPPPGLPATATPSSASPTYSLSAQGNAARLGSPIPVNYGRMRIYPDFAANPYTEYESNEQYLYQLYCIGQGQNRVSDFRLEDTPLSNFDEVTTEVIPPLGKVTMFHTAVVIAPEAGGQDMTDPITLGPYVVNEVDTEISRISVDIVFQAGLMGVDEGSGDEYSVGVHLSIIADLIDDQGDPTGGGATIFNDTISDCTRTAIRRTLSADVDPGRYRVTIQRTTDHGPNNEVRSCSLGSLKGYLLDDNEYGDVTLVAMRIKATANLSDSASRLFNLLNERLIPVWSHDGWSQSQFTRNPAWAFADAVRARYGGDFADSQIDLEGLLYLAGLFDSRVDYFDGRFDTEQSLWDGLGKIGQVCRSGPVRQGNLIRLIRDQHIETPAQVFGMSNMTDFSIDYVMHDDRTADAVKITYWDETRDYAETTVLAQLPDDTADNPQEITLFGCTQYEQAWREGMYLAATNRERRQMVSWVTGLEGHIPTFGDLVIINHDLLGTGALFGGVVEAVDGSVLTLSADVEMPGEHWYMILRDRKGQPSDPLPIEPVSPNRVRVLDTLPYIEDDIHREPTHYVIGQGDQVSWPVKITAITPEADNKVGIAGCIESEFVHTADEGEIPPPPPALKPPPPGLVIEDLIATQGGTLHAPVIFLSWVIARGADRYLIEYSVDGRDTWQPAGTGQSFINQHEFNSEAGLITCRVAAVGAVRGEWATIDVNAGGDFDTPGKVQPQLAEPFTGDALKVRWDKQPAAALYLLEVWSRDALARSLYLDRSITEYQYHYTDAQLDAAGRTLTVKVLAQNAEGVNGDAGEVTATNPPPGVPTGIVIDALIDSFIVRADHSTDTDLREFRVYGTQTAGFVPGIENLLYSGMTPWASLSLKGRWYFRCAWVDQWGATDLNYSPQASGDSSEVDLSPIEEELGDLDDKINKEIEKIELDLTDTQKSIEELDKETDQQLADVRDELLADIDTSVNVEETARISADEALSKRITTVSADLSDETTARKAAVQSEATARATEDEAIGERIDTVAADLSTETTNRTAAVQEETTARATADETLAKQITTVSSELDDETAERKSAIKNETTARTTADDSLATQINQVQSGYQTADSQLDAAIRTESETRASADEALSSQISTVIADYKKGDTENSAAIQTEKEARADADGALGARIDTVIADYKKGDQTNSAAIQSESEARADADGALGKQIDTVQAIANDNKASVQVNASAIATVEDGVETLESSWGVTLDVNGYVSGFAMNNDGDHSEALFRADTFAVGSPGVEALSFVVKDGAVMMPGVSIENGAIKANHMTANSVTAGTIAADAISGREISSATTIIAGSGNSSATLNGVDANWRIYAGSSVADSAPFRVHKSGKMYSTNADIKGKITATSGTFTGTITSSTINGGYIHGADGEFTGEIYAEKISGDVVSFIATYLDEKNYGEGIPSNTWHTIATISAEKKTNYDRYVSIDNIQVYQSNCAFSFRIIDNTGEQLWIKTSNTTSTKTILAMPYGVLKASRYKIKIQIIRYTTTGTNYLQIISGTLRCFLGKSSDMSVDSSTTGFIEDGFD